MARARLVAEELSELLGFADGELRAEYVAALRDRGIASPRMPPVRLAIGETWVLLHEAPDRGWALRLTARPWGGNGGSSNAPPEEVGRAYRGVLSTVAQACRRLPGEAAPPDVELELPARRVRIEGSSLGLSVAVATVSAGLRAPPAVGTAGSAVVLEDGRLGPVEHLPSKLAALRRSWPEVERVVVAAEQELPVGYESPLPLERARTLAEALPLFGLDIAQLGSASLEDHMDRVARLARENHRQNDPARWAVLANEAWESAQALASEEPHASARGALLAASFAVHGGDPGAADGFVQHVTDDLAREYPALLARKLIAQATIAIDGEDPAAAAELAAGAVALCESLPGKDRGELLGQALGTRGRALVHASAFAEAEPLLRRAREHHRQYKPREEARSACYLATCLRMAGRPLEALAEVDAASAEEEGHVGRWDLARTTRLYLRLERGRVLSALGRWGEAAAEFQAVCQEQREEMAYPRLGALRSLAGALRAAGEPARADEALRACLSVVRKLHGVTARRTLQRVAAMAAGDALLEGETAGVARAALEEVWTMAFPESASRAERVSIVAGWVY